MPHMSGIIGRANCVAPRASPGRCWLVAGRPSLVVARCTVSDEHDLPLDRDSTRQTLERTQWVEQLRGLIAHADAGAQALQPPPALNNIRVVLVGTRLSETFGATARVLSAFECLDLVFVAPRSSPHSRRSRKVSKGAEYMLRGSHTVADLDEALQGCETSFAFSRWNAAAGGDQQACRSVHELLEHESVRRALAAQVYSAEGTRLSRKHAEGNGDQVPMDDECAVLAAGAELVIDQAKHMPHEGTHKVALVFGREAEGLTDVEVARCSVACSIPMGRLQESLSLSHAVALVLGQLYERRMEMSAGAGSEIACSSIAAPQPAAL